MARRSDQIYQKPPLFLDVVALGNDTYIDPLFWIDAADEDSPKHRSNIPQFVGGGDIGLGAWIGTCHGYVSTSAFQRSLSNLMI